METIKLYNPYHDSKGRFTSGGSAHTTVAKGQGKTKRGPGGTRVKTNQTEKERQEAMRRGTAQPEGDLGMVQPAFTPGKDYGQVNSRKFDFDISMIHDPRDLYPIYGDNLAQALRGFSSSRLKDMAEILGSSDRIPGTKEGRVGYIATRVMYNGVKMSEVVEEAMANYREYSDYQKFMGDNSTSAVEQGWGGGDDQAEIDRRADQHDNDNTLDEHGDVVYHGRFNESKDTHAAGFGVHSHGKYGKHIHMGSSGNSHEDSQMLPDDDEDSDSRFDAHRFSERDARDAGNELRRLMDRRVEQEYGKPFYRLTQAEQQQLMLQCAEERGVTRAGEERRTPSYEEDAERVEFYARQIAARDYGRMALTESEMLDTYQRAHRLAESEYRRAHRNGGAR